VPCTKARALRTLQPEPLSNEVLRSLAWEREGRLRHGARTAVPKRGAPGAAQSGKEDSRPLARDRKARRLSRRAPAPALAPTAPVADGRLDVVWVAAATCSHVRVMRGEVCPVVAFRDFGGDRGLRLSRMAEIEKTVEQNKSEAGTNNFASRKAIDRASSLGPALSMQLAADHLMDLASDELRRQGDAAGVSALRKEMRTEWGSTATLIYPAGSTLGRHTDGCGNWVVLFSFGRTVTFHCGGMSEDLASGDAILFNGGTKFEVVHGIDRVWGHATVHQGAKHVKRRLPADMAYMEPYRVSVQVRQQDPPASWGWPEARASN